MYLLQPYLQQTASKIIQRLYTFDAANQASFNLTNFSTCATISGSQPLGEIVDVVCNSSTDGRYLTVHKFGRNSNHQICEVIVYDHPDNRHFFTN